jgi:hypothetical protein
MLALTPFAVAQDRLAVEHDRMIPLHAASGQSPKESL